MDARFEFGGRLRGPHSMSAQSRLLPPRRAGAAPAGRNARQLAGAARGVGRRRRQRLDEYGDPVQGAKVEGRCSSATRAAGAGWSACRLSEARPMTTGRTGSSDCGRVSTSSAPRSAARLPSPICRVTRARSSRDDRCDGGAVRDGRPGGGDRDRFRPGAGAGRDRVRTFRQHERRADRRQPSAAAQPAFTVSDGSAGCARIHPDGRFEFPNVSPGEYVIQGYRGRTNGGPRASSGPPASR